MFHDSIAEARFAELRQQFRFDTCIETGTGSGIGALRASQYCNVITIELDDERRIEAAQMWMALGCEQIAASVFKHGEYSITSLRGNSPDVLMEILPGLNNQPLCFYLDAHWNNYWPLLDELKAISDAECQDCIVIIHDCKVPGKDFHYDCYDGVVLDYDYVKDGLNKINRNFRIFYNEKTDPRNEPDSASCGILYATPK